LITIKVGEKIKKIQKKINSNTLFFEKNQCKKCRKARSKIKKEIKKIKKNTKSNKQPKKKKAIEPNN